MSLGCYLQVVGKNFDVDQFLKLSKLKADIVFHRGEQRGRRRKPHPVSGFSIQINNTRKFGDLAPQIPMALKFLRWEHKRLKNIGRFPGVTVAHLVFPCVRERDEYGVERFPSELLALAGECGLSLVLSFYPPDRGLGFDVGDTVRDALGKEHTVISVDLRAARGKGIIRTRRSVDGTNQSHQIIRHGLHLKKTPSAPTRKYTRGDAS
jgi:hypothetical protein